jgi:plasmid stabilization system protein ParE
MKKQFNVLIEENAKIEIANAFDWYELQKEGLGEIFLLEIQRAINSIQKAPKGYQEIINHRQFPLKDFPYLILYEIYKETMYIDAVFHTSRAPEKKPKIGQIK